MYEMLEQGQKGQCVLWLSKTHLGVSISYSSYSCNMIHVSSRFISYQGFLCSVRENDMAQTATLVSSWYLPTDKGPIQTGSMLNSPFPFITFLCFRRSIETIPSHQSPETQMSTANIENHEQYPYSSKRKITAFISGIFRDALQIKIRVMFPRLCVMPPVVFQTMT